MTRLSNRTRVRAMTAVAGICFLGFLASCQSKQEQVESKRDDLQEEREEVAEEQRDVTEAAMELTEAQRAASVEWQQDYLTFKREMVGEITQNEQLILEKRAEIAKLDPSRQEMHMTAVQQAEQLNNELRSQLNNATDSGTEAWTKFKDDFRVSVNRVEETIQAIKVE
jgi:DNA repair exonuclease SbcCD ATPase subunit